MAQSIMTPASVAESTQHLSAAVAELYIEWQFAAFAAAGARAAVKDCDAEFGSTAMALAVDWQQIAVQRANAALARYEAARDENE